MNFPQITNYDAAENLDSKVQYLKQAVSLQQQMLSFEASSQAALEAQSTQIQKLAENTLQAANTRIQKLENQISVPHQESILQAENGELKQEIAFLQMAHQEEWSALLKKSKTTIEVICTKVRLFILAFKVLKKDTKEAAKLANETLRFRSFADVKDPEYTSFIQRWQKHCQSQVGSQPLVIHELFYSKAKYETAVVSITALKACLNEISAIAIKTEAKLPAYINLSTGKNLEPIDQGEMTQKMIKALGEDTVTKLKISNASLKIMKNEMQKSHLFFVDDFQSFLYKKTIQPALRHIQMCVQAIEKLNQSHLKVMSPHESEGDKILVGNIRKRTVIKIQLERLISEIEEIALSKQ